MDSVRAALQRAAVDRTAAALVGTPDTVLEVSVAPGGRWVVRSHSIEWVSGPDQLVCWEVLSAGARPLPHNRPRDWVHPAVGMLWPDRLPIWGRIGDSHQPERVIQGAAGPGQLMLAPVDPAAPIPGAFLDLDPVRWLCLQLHLPDRVWTLQEYREQG